jgi:hypothetical protein
MEFSAASLFASFLVGLVGLGLFLYGKKQVRLPQLVIGIVLMVFPYFISRYEIVYAVAGALVLGLWFALRLGW